MISNALESVYIVDTVSTGSGSSSSSSYSSVNAIGSNLSRNSDGTRYYGRKNNAYYFTPINTSSIILPLDRLSHNNGGITVNTITSSLVGISGDNSGGTSTSNAARSGVESSLTTSTGNTLLQCRMNRQCSHYSKTIDLLKSQGYEHSSYYTGIEEASCAPSIAVPGFMKSGTAFLFQMISSHPQVLPPLRGKRAMTMIVITLKIEIANHFILFSITLLSN
jgi:hypothetical protein